MYKYFIFAIQNSITFSNLYNLTSLLHLNI